jgi:hypothetical protein
MTLSSASFRAGACGGQESYRYERFFASRNTAGKAVPRYQRQNVRHAEQSEASLEILKILHPCSSDSG